MLRTARTLLPPAVAAAVLLTGCGGGGDDGQKTVAASAPGATAASPATDEAAVRAQKSAPGGVVERYIAAFTQNRGEQVCKLYTKQQRARVAKVAKTTCADGINVAFQAGGGDDSFQEGLGNLKVASSKVSGDDAVVTLVATQGAGAATGTGLSMRLRKEDGEWRIAQPDVK